MDGRNGTTKADKFITKSLPRQISVIASFHHPIAQFQYDRVCLQVWCERGGKDHFGAGMPRAIGFCIHLFGPRASTQQQ